MSANIKIGAWLQWKSDRLAHAKPCVQCPLPQKHKKIKHILAKNSKNSKCVFAA
jgi:hypothetical protein